MAKNPVIKSYANAPADGRQGAVDAFMRLTSKLTWAQQSNVDHWQQLGIAFFIIAGGKQEEFDNTAGGTLKLTASGARKVAAFVPCAGQVDAVKDRLELIVGGMLGLFQQMGFEHDEISFLDNGLLRFAPSAADKIMARTTDKVVARTMLEFLSLTNSGHQQH